METLAKTIWTIDPTHSEAQFKVKHLVISTVTGHFKNFTASIESKNENFQDAHATFKAEIDSISTNNGDRDGHLKSADFFDAVNYPNLKFESTQFNHISGNDYEIIGILTLKNVSKEVKLKAEFGGEMQDPYGNTKIGFEIEGKINRQDYGLTWSSITEAGGVVVSDEVKLILNLQFVTQA